MTVREKILSDINVLTDAQVRQVADYLKLLKSNKRKKVAKTNGSRPDAIFKLGKHPVKTGITDASERLDKYLY